MDVDVARRRKAGEGVSTSRRKGRWISTRLERSGSEVSGRGLRVLKDLWLSERSSRERTEDTDLRYSTRPPSTRPAISSRLASGAPSFSLARETVRVRHHQISPQLSFEVHSARVLPHSPSLRNPTPTPVFVPTRSSSFIHGAIAQRSSHSNEE